MLSGEALIDGGDDAVHLGIQFLVLRVEAAVAFSKAFGGGGQPGGGGGELFVEFVHGLLMVLVSDGTH